MRYHNPVFRPPSEANSLILQVSLGLLRVLNKLYQTFPRLERVGIYAGPKDILKKPGENLVKLQQAGLKIVYLGLETGSENLLRAINKGVNV